MREVLFRPFDIRKWLSIGFCSFLAGRSASFRYSQSHSTQKTHFSLADIQQYIHQHPTLVICGSLGVLTVFLAVFFLIIWLNCRGKFMFLHCVVSNRGEIRLPWRKYKKAAENLWKLNALLGVLIVFNVLAAVGVIIWGVMRNPYPNHHFVSDILLPSLPMLAAFGLTALIFGIIQSFTSEFVVPIMYLRGGTWEEAWRELGGLIKVHPRKFILYILFQLVIGLGVLLVIIVAVLCTCCLGGLLLLIPYISSVCTLPISVFQRFYSLHYLAQYGEEFDVCCPTPPNLPGSRNR